MIDSKIKKGLLFVAIVIMSVTTVVFAKTTATGTFSLTYGQYERSKYAKLEASFPYVKYDSREGSNCSNLRVTLSKKAGLGFTNKELVTTSLNGEGTFYAYFKEHESDTKYLITSVNASQGSTANAYYTLTSKSTAGSV